MTRPAGRAGRGIGVLLAVAGLGALAVAAWVEHGLGDVPCGLCLWERWPYRVLAGMGLIVALSRGRVRRGALWLCVPVVLAACGLSVLHVGVEQGWWPSPLPECRAPVFHGGSFAQRLAAMPLRPSKPCDAPTYLIGALPLSMTAMGGLYAAGLLAVIAYGLGPGRRTGRR